MIQTMTLRKSIIHIFCLCICVLLAVACSHDIDTPVSDSSLEHTNIALSMDMEEISTEDLIATETGSAVSEPEMRMYFENRAMNGVAFQYTAKEQIKAVLFFRQGTTIKFKVETLEVEKHQPSKGTYKLKLKDVTLPAGITDQANLEISGMIGVTNPRVEAGKCLVDVPSSAQVIKVNGRYSVPMYFPFTPVHALENGKFGLYSKFNLYGAVVGLHITNKHKYPYKLKEVELKTSTMTTEGTVDLASAGTAQTPKPLVWTSKQTANSRQMVQLTSPNDNYEIAARNGSKYFFFWVMPKEKISTNSKLKIGLKSFRTVERPGKEKNSTPDLFATTVVKKALKPGKVHRVPTIEAPMPQDLIFSQIFVGSGDEAIALEVYNASDTIINLNDYYIRSYDRNGTGHNFLLLRGEHSEFRLLMDEHRNTPPTYSKMPSLRQTDIDNKRFILNPKEMALYLTTTVTINKNLMTQQKALHWIFNFSATDFPGIKLDTHGGYYELRRKEGGEIVDVLLKFKEGQHHNIDSYTLVRKPYHDRPRQYMKLGEKSDWVVRERKENTDWGLRFGFASGDATNYYLSDMADKAGVVLRDNRVGKTPYPVPSWWTPQ